MTTNKPSVWVLADDRAGNVSQCVGVAEKLGVPYETKQIRYTDWVKLPNILRGASLIGINEDESDKLQAPFPDIVIAAGRRAAPVARYIKRHSPSTKLVQIMWPGNPTKDFDLIAVPRHDSAKPAPQILRIALAPHQLTKQLLQKEGELWEPQFSYLPKPWVAVLVGGNSKHAKFGLPDAAQLMRQAEKLAGEGSLLISSSRRTGEELEEELCKGLKEPYYFFRWEEGKKNPYRAFLALAEKIIVTGDSISMLSEACFTGKPVYVYSPNPAAKFARFQQYLFETGHAAPLGSTTSRFVANNEPLPLDSAADIARHIRACFLNNELTS